MGDGEDKHPEQHYSSNDNITLKFKASRNTRCFCNIIYTNVGRKHTEARDTTLLDLEFNLRNG